MSFACDLAVVLRTRGGRDVMVQTRGIDAKLALQASQEMAMLLEDAASFDDPGDVASAIQGQPLTCGSVRVLGGRLRVLYRVVHNMMILVITRSRSYSLLALALQSAVLRILLAEAKQYELSYERIERKYGDIYLAIDALLTGNGVVGTRTAIDEAAIIMGHVGQPGKRPKLVENGGVKGSPLFTYRVAKRTLAGQAEQTHSLAFNTAQYIGTMRPLPGFDIPELRLGAPPQAFAPQAAATAAPDDPFAEVADPFGEVELLKAQPAPESPRGVEALVFEKEPESWASFGDGDATPGMEAVPGSFVPPLQLAEVWRAEVVGAAMQRAGLSGTVRWVDDAARTRYQSIQFTLQLPAEARESDEERLAVSLRSAHRHHMGTRLGVGQGVFIADSGPARQMATPTLLKYHLQPLQCPVPLRCQLSAALQPAPGGQMALLLSMLYVLNPKIDALFYQDLLVTVAVPALFELPVKAAPSSGCEFDCKLRTLTWRLTVASGDLTAGRSGSLAAVFVAPANVDARAASAALKRVTADVVLKGAPGTTLSGASLLQGGLTFLEPSGEQHVGWEARITARLREG